jgi:hypothetical protein
MTINDHQNIKQNIKTDKQIGDDFVCAPEGYAIPNPLPYCVG